MKILKYLGEEYFLSFKEYFREIFFFKLKIRFFPHVPYVQKMWKKSHFQFFSFKFSEKFDSRTTLTGSTTFEKKNQPKDIFMF